MLIPVVMLLVRMWNVHQAAAKPCSHVCLFDPVPHLAEDLFAGQAAEATLVVSGADPRDHAASQKSHCTPEIMLHDAPALYSGRTSATELTDDQYGA
jgi:hypothetical protein